MDLQRRMVCCLSVFACHTPGKPNCGVVQDGRLLYNRTSTLGRWKPTNRAQDEARRSLGRREECALTTARTSKDDHVSRRPPTVVQFDAVRQ